VVLLFNIIHGNQSEQNALLLRKVSSSLTSQGQVVILDQLEDAKGSGPTARAIAALTGLHMYNASGGQAYRFTEIAGWLGAAGFIRPRRVLLLRSPGNALVMATKAS